MQMILGNQSNGGNEAIGIWVIWMYVMLLSMKSIFVFAQREPKLQNILLTSYNHVLVWGFWLSYRLQILSWCIISTRISDVALGNFKSLEEIVLGILDHIQSWESGSTNSIG